jgi:hypothetical protein
MPGGWNLMKKASIGPHSKVEKGNVKFVLIVACFLLMGLMGVTPVMAELASPDEMEQVCRNWLTYIISQTGDWAGDTDPEIVAIRDIMSNDMLLARYYAISSGGYIIVPVLKELAPVKAYSEEYTFDPDEPGGFALMLKEVLASRMQIFAEVYGSLEVAQPNTDNPLFDQSSRLKWDKYAAPSVQFVADKSPTEPLDEAGPLLTTSWHQGAPYNNLCPEGDGDRCVVGCVATAAAQIVWYYAWPPYGQGQHSYFWNGDQSCDGDTPGETLYADYSDPYEYDGSHAAMAELSYEMGVAYEMNYGACASGAWTMQGVWIYPQYYRYLDVGIIHHRDEHSASSWFETIKAEIDMRRPILYQIPRHAIVCDGWREADGLDQYHFNYGWGGSNNAWYTVDDLHCPWDGCDPMYEVMLINIIPDKGIAWLRSDGLSDLTFGNGNDIYEAGETVEVSFTIINFGGAALSDIDVTLMTDDASLNITNGSTHFSGINALDSINNSANRFTFEIPVDYVPRTDSFFLAISWNGGEGADTVIFEQNIGHPSILLVDDDDGAHYEEYYDESFSPLRIPYDVWDASLSSPDMSDLSSYDIIFWYTGGYRTDPLSSDEVTAMKGYMDGGGKLFLTGQAIAAQLSAFDPDFLHDYLRSTYITSKSVNEMPILEGEPGLICDTSVIIAIISGSGAGNQAYPDLIDSANGGILELKFMGQDFFGGVTYSGSYDLIFFSFGFEAVIKDDYRWTDRDTLFSDILDFFDYHRPNALPEVIDLAISPGDPTHLLDHTPEMTWTYFDASSEPQTQYHIQVGVDYDWSTVEMWDYGPVPGDEAIIQYNGSVLEDGRQYYVRIRAHNGTLWSDWFDGTFRMNSAPASPLSLSPIEMQGVIVTDPEFTHANSPDSEDDAVTYSYELFEDSLMAVLIDQATGQPENPSGITSWPTGVGLSEDQAYYWRVRGSDPFEDGPWSDLAAFWINTENQIPGSFSLITPDLGAVLSNPLPTFGWEESLDGDPYDQISYTLFYGTDPEFSGATVVGELDSNAYTPTTLLDAGSDYYWKVTAFDLFGGEINSSQIFNFSFPTLGDANGDGILNVGDAVYLIAFIFKGGPGPEPYEAGDANCDDFVDVGDAVFLISYIFRGGPPPECR